MTTDAALDRRLVDFVRALREHGINAGPSETVDAAHATSALSLIDRERLRTGLAAALLRRAGQRQVFDEVFDVWFPPAVGDRTDVGTGPPVDLSDPRAARKQAATLRAELAEAMAANDVRALEHLVARTVTELGRLPNEATAGSYSAAQALDLLAPTTAIAPALAAMVDAAADAPGGAGDGSGGGVGSGRGHSGGPSGGGFADRFTRDELRSRVSEFATRVAAETRRRNAEARGAERISRYAVRPSAEQLPLMLHGKTDVQDLRRTIAPLAAKLGTRLAARARRADRGRIDVRRTLRASMATGGVPLRPVFERRRPGRADLVVLADMSSSVAGFSRFTILLLQALGAQFRRVRIFGFVNVVDELTQTILDAPPGADLSATFDDTARMTRWHRSSDYGSALTDFVTHYPDAVTHRSVVLILGDARTNGTDPAYAVLADLTHTARRVIWLNPEPHRSWGTGDSVAHRYGEIVDMHECRTLAQLRAFVSRELPV